MKRLLLTLAVMLSLSGIAMAQRHITPVTPVDPVTNPSKTKAPKPEADKPDLTKMAHYHDEQGNVVLVDTITGQEWVDSTSFRRPGYVYPLLHSVTFGVDIWDPVMRILGQKYGGATVWGEISFHNRFNPVFEFGMSVADDTPSGMNFTYHSPLSPYFKIGANYNFLYNSNPDYQMLALVRYGFTSYKYQLKNVLVNNPYWEEEVPVDFPSQTSTAGYFEIGIGVKVKIVGPLSLGWMAKFHTILHESAAPYGDPMVIPGFGKRNSTLTGAFSIMYTIGLNKPAPSNVDI